MRARRSLFAFCCLLTTSVSAQFSGGTGTANDPYIITSYAQLKQVELTSLSAHYRLGADVDATASASDDGGAGFDPINSFAGTFSGAGYAIRDLHIVRGNWDYVGMFAVLDSGGVIDSLRLIDVTIDGQNPVGGLVGRNDGGTIRDCAVTGVIFGQSEVGGIAGENNGTILRSYCSIRITGYSTQIGGLVGLSEGGTISHCYATGSVQGTQTVGGLVGWNEGAISNCYATTTVTATAGTAAGLVHSTWLGSNISNSFAAGSVSSSSTANGLIASNNPYTTNTNCFWDMTATGTSVSAAGTGRSSSQMRQSSTFADAGWDLGSVWRISPDSSYPGLRTVENAPIAFSETYYRRSDTLAISQLLENDFDLESGIASLTYSILSLSSGSIVGGVLTLPTDPPAGPYTITYRVGNVSGTDTLWGQIVTSILMRTYLDGSGTVSDPFLVASYADLAFVTKGLTSHYRLLNDIDASASASEDGGAGFDPIDTFTGTFNGGGHAIHDLSISRPSWDYVGLFALIGNGGWVDSLELIDAQIVGKNYVGALVGRQYGGKVKACRSSGTVQGAQYVGGLAGESGAVVTLSASSCSVSGSALMIGGLVGYSNSGSIDRSSASGSVSGGSTVGGLVGYQSSSGSVTNAYATGSVSGSHTVGGLIGNIVSGSVATSYSAGLVSSGGTVGGLAALKGGSATVTSSYWDTETSDQGSSAAGTGKTTAEMTTPSTFAAWDSTIWSHDVNSGYPTLSWQVEEAPLPVQMMSLAADHVGGQVRLCWRTASEVDNAGWEVERRVVSRQYEVGSKEKEGWVKIGFVEGAGTSTSAREYCFTDRSIFGNRQSSIDNSPRFVYRLKQLDRSGSSSYSHEVEVEIGTAPREFTLSQNYPNPFNPATSIGFTVPEDGQATLKVFDLLGREVAILFNGEAFGGRLYQTWFDARGLASGTYVYRLTISGRSIAKRLMLTK